jgi:hypothetical protein
MAISSGIFHEIVPAGLATTPTNPAAAMAITARATPPATATTLQGNAPDPYPAGVLPVPEATGSTPTEEGASKVPAAALKAVMEEGDCPEGDPGRDGEPLHRMKPIIVL